MRGGLFDRLGLGADRVSDESEAKRPKWPPDSSSETTPRKGSDDTVSTGPLTKEEAKRLGSWLHLPFGRPETFLPDRHRTERELFHRQPLRCGGE
jgi:hypothetical protein